MANRRMIAKSISVSDETNALSDFAALLFTWLIPHSDDYGVIPGSPGRIKALVVPRRKQSEADIDAALEEMRRVGLIYRYFQSKEDIFVLKYSLISFCFNPSRRRLYAIFTADEYSRRNSVRISFSLFSSVIGNLIVFI